MNTEENIHQGHRRRLLAKLVANSELLADHELLEALLYLVIPRRDTNPLAHRLLKVFGSLNGVLTAEKEELEIVDGVGAKTAETLLLISAIFKRSAEGKVEHPEFNTTEKIKRALSGEFKGQAVESSVVVLLDKNYRKIFQLSYASQMKDQVELNLNEIVKAISRFNPAYILLAHNHVLGECYPSESDDNATRQLELVCRIHGVRLVEHSIFKGESGYYSYRDDNRLEMIQKESDLYNKLPKLKGE